MEQGSEQWFKDRIGKITSSEFWKILKPKGFGDTGETYLYEKAAERITGIAKAEVTSRAIEWGNEHEPLARRWVAHAKGWEIIEEGFKQRYDLDWYGGSVDGRLVGAGYPLEIKCPYVTANHLKLSARTKDIELFKKKHPDYYWQCQSHSFISTSKKTIFASFDPRIPDDRGLIIREIPTNYQDHAFMRERLIEAENFIQQILK